jgi:hypothetical protein
MISGSFVECANGCTDVKGEDIEEEEGRVFGGTMIRVEPKICVDDFC